MDAEEVELFLQLDAQTLSLRSILQDAGHAVSSSPGSRRIGSGLMLFIIFRRKPIRLLERPDIRQKIQLGLNNRVAGAAQSQGFFWVWPEPFFLFGSYTYSYSYSYSSSLL